MRLPETTFKVTFDSHLYDGWLTIINLSIWFWGFSFMLFGVRVYLDIGRSWEK